jgi:hypothetical protein
MFKSAALFLIFTYQAFGFAFLPVPSRAPGFRYPLVWPLNSMAEKVLEAPKWPPEWPYSENDFSRMDESGEFVRSDSGYCS